MPSKTQRLKTELATTAGAIEDTVICDQGVVRG